MLFTLTQMNAYVDYALTHYNVKDQDGNPAGATHALRMQWQQEQNIAPLRAGQELEINGVDGLSLSVVVQNIKKDGITIQD